MATLDDLRVLNAAATPGPWYYDGRDVFSIPFQGAGHRLVLPVPETFHPDQRVSDADLRLIVALRNELLDRLVTENCALCDKPIEDEPVVASDGAAVHEACEGGYEDIVYFREFEE